MRMCWVILLSFLAPVAAFSQSASDVDALIGNLRCQSKAIRTEQSVAAMMKGGIKLLPVLAEHFTDTTITAVFSKCANRYLNRGEIAIIIADGIEGMPYFTLTGLQNCTLESCPDSPNWIEYYLNFIKQRMKPVAFQEKYLSWLKSSDRKKYLKH